MEYYRRRGGRGKVHIDTSEKVKGYLRFLCRQGFLFAFEYREAKETEKTLICKKCSKICRAALELSERVVPP